MRFFIDVMVVAFVMVVVFQVLLDFALEIEEFED